MIGQSVSNYRIVRELGRAGLGDLWLARDTQAGKLVALKLLPAELPADVGEVRRAFEDARKVCEPSHPHICTVHDSGDHEGRCFLVMEVAEGEPLSERLKSGALDPDILLDLGVQIGDALRTAHARGIFHGALSPENVLVTEGDQIKLMDFGLARLLRPEAGAGQDARREDIRSLGKLLHAMATGGMEGASASSVNPRVPPALDGIIDRAVAREKETTYENLTELVEDLCRVMSEAAPRYVPPPPAETPEPDRTGGLHWRWILTVGLAVVAVLVAVRACG